jgi:hypothetical protein
MFLVPRRRIKEEEKEYCIDRTDSCVELAAQYSWRALDICFSF